VLNVRGERTMMSPIAWREEIADDRVN
jgi:hypothetical protein